VNAHKLITKANESSADVLFILDCFFPTQSITQWKRDDHMTEIIIAGREMHDVNGRPIAGSENFDEAFSGAMRDILDEPRGESRQTIPRVMGRDKSLCTTPQRYWLNRPDRLHPERRVWRFFLDIGRLKNGGGLLQLRRCEVTGRRKGEFGGDPDLENDGWGPDGGDGGDDGGGDDDEGDARYDGGDDSNDDGGGHGDSSNGGWGRGFGRTRRRGGPKDQDEVGDDAGNDNQGEGEDDGNSVVQQWAQLHRSLGLPKKLTDEEAIDLVKRLQGLPKQLKRQNQLPTPSSSGIRKRSRGERAISADAGVIGRSKVAIRPRRNSPVSPDCEIVTTKRVGHKLGSPIDLSREIETIESSDRATRKRSVRSWLEDVEEIDNKTFVKLEGSPAPRSSGNDTASVKRESSVESELEITSAGPVNRPIDRGALIDLTDAPDDVTGDPG
jgi:hypothetical protein